MIRISDIEYTKHGRELKIDSESDALYFRPDESSIVDSEEVQPGVILDYDAQGRVVGMETLRVSERITPDGLRVVHLGT